MFHALIAIAAFYTNAPATTGISSQNGIFAIKVLWSVQPAREPAGNLQRSRYGPSYICSRVISWCRTVCEIQNYFRKEEMFRSNSNLSLQLFCTHSLQILAISCSGQCSQLENQLGIFKDSHHSAQCRRNFAYSFNSVLSKSTEVNLKSGYILVELKYTCRRPRDIYMEIEKSNC